MRYLLYLNFFCLVTYLYMTIFILTRNPRSLKNITCAALFSSIILWNLGWAVLQTSHVSTNVARVFLNVSAVGGITFGGFFLWFTLVFIEKEKTVKMSLFYILVFFIPLLLIFMQLRYNSIISIPDFIPFHHRLIFNLHKSIWTLLYCGYTFCAIGIGFYWGLIFRNTTKSELKKKQTTFMVFTGIIAVTFTTTSVLIFLFSKSVMGTIPYLGNAFFLIWACGLFYVISKYKFLTLTPYNAAKNIIETMSDSLLLLDVNDKIKFVNSATLNLLGFTEKELINKPVNFIFNEPPIQIEELKKLIHAGPVTSIETNYRSKDEKAVPVLFSSSVMFNEDNTSYGMVCIAHDISNLKQIQGELQRVQRLQSLGILAGGIAHDFNNLLSGIFGYIELAKKQTSPDQKIYRYLESALNSFDNAKNLAQQLLTFAKGNTPAKEIASIEKIVKAATKFALSGSNVNCNFRFEDGLWAVEVDKNQISQVFNNIIINARQAMVDSGFIEIEAKNTLLKQPALYHLEKNEYIQVSITDYGVGIPEEDIPKIFDPFFTTKHNGVGLGLTICHSIIKNHGGHISVTSKRSSGTTFTIYLPASGEKIVEVEEKSLSHDLNSGWKILLMDDEAFLLDLLKEMLEEMGNTVVVTKNGEEAVVEYINALESSDKFDAVIFDLTVRGGMGGKKALEKLLQVDPQIKGIASSGYSEDPIIAHPKEYGFQSAIKKPFKIEELVETLGEMINAN